SVNCTGECSLRTSQVTRSAVVDRGRITEPIGGLSLTANPNRSNGFRLDRRLAIITGGASGIGRAIAQRFASHGAIVRIVDVDEKVARSVVQEIVASGGDAKAYGCDVSSQDSVKGAFERVFAEGRLSILVNNAGISHVGSLEKT